MNTITRKMAVSACFLFGLFFLVWHALDKSVTYDEVTHIQCGYYHWKQHNFERGLEHPPFLRLWAALPLNFLRLIDPDDAYPSLFPVKPISNTKEYLYGALLIFKNPFVSADRIALVSRLMMILITLGLFGLVYHWSAKIYGWPAGLLSLFLMVTCPPFLGHGSLVLLDVGGAASAVFALYCFSRYLDDPTPSHFRVSALALGLAQICKISNLILIPVFLVMLWFRTQPARKKLVRSVQLLFICGLVINLCYGFQEFMPPHRLHPIDQEAYHWPALVEWLYEWSPLPDFYLKSAAFMSYHVREGLHSYILGKVHPTGVWYYFPFAFLVKTPVAALVLVVVTLFSFLKEKPNAPEKILIFALLFYALNSLFSKLDIGVRHFLFVYPLLFILAGRTLKFANWDGNKKKILVGVVVASQLLEVALAAPHFIAYFSYAAGGPKSGVRYLSDMDIGQDLKRLGQFMERHPDSELVLSYFGAALPEYYKIHAQELLPTGTQIHNAIVNSDSPRQEFLAVSIPHLQGFMKGEETFAWLRQRKPVEFLGYSIAVFDISADAESHNMLAKIYQNNGEMKKSQRHLRRAASLSTQFRGTR